MSRSCQKLNQHQHCTSFSNYIFSSSSSSRSIFSPWPSSSSSSRFGFGSSSSFSYTRPSSSSSSRACSSSPRRASSSIFSSGLPPMPRSRRPSRPLSSSYSDALIKSSQVTLLPKTKVFFLNICFSFSETQGTFGNSTPTSSNLRVSSDSLGFDLNIFFHSIKPTPFKTNIDYYRGKTKSIYEKEPIFRDFARNIPLSQSLDDSTSLHELKRDFQKLVSARDPVLGRPDPLKPSAVGPIFWPVLYLPRKFFIQD